PVWPFWLGPEHVVDRLHRERVLASGRVAPCRSVRDREVLTVEADDIVLRCEIPERIEELTAYDIRSRTHLRKLRGIQLQEITVLLVVFDDESRGDAIALRSYNHPRAAASRRRGVAGAALEFGD